MYVYLQALNISPYDLDQLDERLASSLMHAGVDGHQFRPDVVVGGGGGVSGGAREGEPAVDSSHEARRSDEEFPTLLHFAARFGFGKLTWKLVECPGWHSAAQLRNRHGFNVLQMAQHFGHAEIATIIESAQEIHVTLKLIFGRRIFGTFISLLIFVLVITIYLGSEE